MWLQLVEVSSRSPGHGFIWFWLLLYLVVSVLAASWVAQDVTARRLPQPLLWGAATFVTFPWVFVVYFIWTHSPWYRDPTL